MKIKKIKLVAVLSLSIMALIVISLMLIDVITYEKPQQISMLTSFYADHTYQSFALTDCRFTYPIGSKLCVSTTFHTEDTDTVLRDALLLKSEIEDFLKANSELYADLLFDYTLSTDSAYGYIKISNYDPESGDLTNPYSFLAYGDFHGALGSITPLKDSSMFEHIRFIDYQYFDDFSAFDNQVNLKDIQFIACKKLTENDICYLKDTHPDCLIQLN